MRALPLAIALTSTLVPWLSGSMPVQEQADTPDEQRAVLITGASSGIGRCTAELLASKGFFVYAGARKEQDLKDLSAIENIQGIRLDVTSPEEIEAAVETVRAGGRGLYGLINNAGVIVRGPLIELPEADLEFVWDVNVFGPYRVTKAFAPLIIESRGCISTTGSISGIRSGPFGGPYTMSKHAIEAFSDSLAAELAPFDVRVSVVEPGNYNSKIAESMRKRLEARGYTAEGSRFEKQMQRMLDSSGDRSHHKEPDEVAEAFLHALTSETPKLRYMVVPSQREADITLRAAIRKAVQLNHDQPYAHDRDGLIEMLDEALAEVGGR